MSAESRRWTPLLTLVLGASLLLLVTPTGATKNDTPLWKRILDHANPSESIPTGWPRGFVASLLMIVVSEVGDKTFIITALLAMRQPQLVIFGAATAALAVMTLLSVAFGLLLPLLIPLRLTRYIAGVLFLLFGGRAVMEAISMPTETVAEAAEYGQVAQELDRETNTKQTTGDVENNQQISTSELHTFHVMQGNRATDHSLDTPSLWTRWTRNSIFLQAFSLVFLAEWGDRSQLATIALAASENAVGVALGAIVGHAICTALACLAGGFLASVLSVRTVTMLGGCLFLIFGVLSFV